MHTYISGEFLGLTGKERLTMCRKLAAEAERLAAAAANPELKQSYLDLKRQWDALAAEMEASLRDGEERASH